MASNISLEGGTLKVDDGTDISYYRTDDVTLKVKGTSIDLFLNDKEVDSFALADITTPTGATLELIADEIASWLVAGASSSVAHGLGTVTTATTRVQIATNAAKSITIKATATNTGTIYVGGSTVSSANGFPLLKGDTISVDIANTDNVWLDASVSGETVNWISIY